ncbi:hypothetical protein ACFSTC_53975 [Nonomuraea ferruginea]
MRVSGARITGALQIFGGTVEHELVLSGCHLEGPVRLTDCRTRTVRLTDCRLPSFGGVGMRVEGHLSLSGSHVTGPVQVMRAQFATGLWLARHQGGAPSRDRAGAAGHRHDRRLGRLPGQRRHHRHDAAGSAPG